MVRKRQQEKAAKPPAARTANTGHRADGTARIAERPRRRKSVLIVVVVLLGGGAAWWALYRTKPRPRSLEGAARGYNVLLITMDTTRADCLGCYGHPVVKTPHIDRLASEGALFTQCMATCPLTLPSHASIMTGTYPFVHRARNNGRYLADAGNTTLAEVLRDAGYQTCAQVSAYVLDAVWGIDQGFTTYRSETGTRPVRQRIKHMDTLQTEPADKVVSRGLAWLDDAKPDRFFLWLHFFDAHEPCNPPPRFRTRYRDPYFGEIAFVDEQIGRLRAALKQRGLLDRTLIVLTADHGEGRRDHRELTHSYFVYDSTMRVPLIFWQPRLIPPNLRVECTVSTVDIAPTLYALAGVDEPPGVQGTPLTPLLEQTATDLGGSVYGESVAAKHAFGYAVLRTLRAGGWKYIHAPKPELYDLVHDPGERRNVIGLHPDRSSAMRTAMATLIADAAGAIADPQRATQLDAEATQKLSALGYVGGYTPPDAPDERESMETFTGPDPKDHIDVYNRFMQARSWDKRGDHEKARQILESLVQREPTAPAFRELLCRQLRELKRTDEAIEQYRALVGLQPHNALAHYYLGRLYGDRKNYAAGLVHLQKAARAMPDDADTQSYLGLALVHAGKTDEAETAFRRALTLDPHQTGARTELCTLLEKRGDWTAAGKLLEDGYRLDPDNVEAMNNLAWFLATAPVAELRDGNRAVELATAARAALPEQVPSVLDTLSAAYAQAGRYDDAVTTATKALTLLGDQDARLAAQIRERLAVYQNRHAYHQK